MNSCFQIQVNDSKILLGFSVGVAVLDVETNDAMLENCQKLIANHDGRACDVAMGVFGPFPVTLNVHPDGTLSVFIDGPDFTNGRCQSAAIWPDRKDFVEAIAEARKAVQLSRDLDLT